jgi:amino-acid N-acetyltransferase
VCPAAADNDAVAGLKRAHLVDARLDGGMLLELYSRDGVGTMISTDFYEGIRRAASRDLEAIAVSQVVSCSISSV